MSINISIPENLNFKPRITVIGVGGAGCNAVNNMIASGLEGTDFIVANTDSQSLEHSRADKRIQLGENVTKGLGAGASPDIGKAAAEEAKNIITQHLENSNMVFITAGMGGGTGTGAAPVIANLAREQGLLTVGVVTKPFHFEGIHRMQTAEKGLEELQKNVDTLIVIPNQNLFRIANEKTTFADAFKMADDVLRDGVRSITDLMIMPGLINLDFADIKAVMNAMGKAMMGSGEAEGDNRSIIAAEAAISNPLLDNSSMKGAKGVLINITGGSDMTLFEVDEAANRIREEVDQEAKIIFGSAFNESLDGKIRVSVVATGITNNPTLEDNNKDQLTNIEESKSNEFIKKNIPESYPRKELEDSENSQKEKNDLEQNVFIPPKPEEPKQYVEIEQSKQNKKEILSKSSKGFTAKTLSIFGKMVASIGSKNDQNNYNKHNHSLKHDMFESNRAEKELVTEDIIDIPDTHRKK